MTDTNMKQKKKKLKPVHPGEVLLEEFLRLMGEEKGTGNFFKEQIVDEFPNVIPWSVPLRECRSHP